MDRLLTPTPDVDSARENLLDFTLTTFPRYKAEPAHRLVADKLQAVLRGEIKRLMIFMPPQHGKTELVVVRFIPFWLGHRPDDPVILTSYAADLANAKSWEAREVVESPAYRTLFPNIRTEQRSRAQDFWRLDGKRGYVNASGIGGAIAGWGAALGIVDDPLKNWEEAQSPAIREKAWNWWRSTFRTRIWEGGAIILMTTRWHQADLAGKLLAQDAEKWTVLRLPAFAESQEERDFNNEFLGLSVGQPEPLGREPGEPLCPRRYSEKALEEIRSELTELMWGAIYQGVPRQPAGERLSADMFQVVDTVPEGARRVRYWDKGGVAKKEGAYTSGVLVAVFDNVYYVEDVVRGRWGFGEREAIIKSTAEQDRASYGRVEIWFEQEPGSGGQESAHNTLVNLAGYIAKADRVTGSKDVRLEPFIAQAQGGNVRLKRGRWNWAWLEELCTVPYSRFRDQADATAGAFNKLTLSGGGGTLHRVRLPHRY